MHISWLGTSAVKLQGKPQSEDVLVVIDPYKPKEGNFPRSITPQIVLYSRGQKDSVTLSADPFILDSAGECEVKGVLVTAVQGPTSESVYFRIDMEGMSIGHLGLTNKDISAAQLNVLGGVDILLVPFGHKDAYDAGGAVKAINAIEPRIVIPISFQSENDPDAKPLDNLLKELGNPGEKPEKKVIIKKKDLPQEDMQIILLEKE